MGSSYIMKIVSNKYPNLLQSANLTFSNFIKTATFISSSQFIFHVYLRVLQLRIVMKCMENPLKFYLEILM